MWRCEKCTKFSITIGRKSLCVKQIRGRMALKLGEVKGRKRLYIGEACFG